MKNFYLKFSACILLLCFSFISYSQSGWDTLPWKSYADYRLQPLNKTYVTTGVLYDRVFPIAHMDEHTGLSLDEDTTSPDHFKQGYYEMYNSIYNPNGIKTPDDLENMLDTFPAWNGHPIGIIYSNFKTLDGNSLHRTSFVHFC